MPPFPSRVHRKATYSYRAHTTNPVPFIMCGAGDVKLHPGRLADIAPTMLHLMGLEQPKAMTGECLIN